MALVSIEKSNKKLVVSRGAYDNLYKKAGWVLTNESKVVKLKDEEQSSPETTTKKDEWDEADEELAKEQKSIDEMDYNELKKLATSKGINTKEIKTIGALKKAIKEAM